MEKEAVGRYKNKNKNKFRNQERICVKQPIPVAKKLA